MFYEVLLEKKASLGMLSAGAGAVAGDRGRREAEKKLIQEGYTPLEARRLVMGGALGGMGRSLGYGLVGGTAADMLASAVTGNPRARHIASVLGNLGGSAYGVRRGYKAPQERAQDILDSRKAASSKKLEMKSKRR